MGKISPCIPIGQEDLWLARFADYLPGEERHPLRCVAGENTSTWNVAHQLRHYKPGMIGEVLGLLETVRPGTRLIQQQHDAVLAGDDPLSDALDLLGERDGAISENLGLAIDATRVLEPGGELRQRHWPCVESVRRWSAEHRNLVAPAQRIGEHAQRGGLAGCGNTLDEPCGIRPRVLAGYRVSESLYERLDLRKAWCRHSDVRFRSWWP